jgi:hypothetical protein
MGFEREWSIPLVRRMDGLSACGLNSGASTGVSASCSIGARLAG